MLDSELAVMRRDEIENAKDLVEALFLLVDIDLKEGSNIDERLTVRVRSILRRHGMIVD